MALRAAAEKERKERDGQAARVSALEHELTSVRRERDEAVKEARAAAEEQRIKEVRLHRALEEVEKHRAALRAMREDRDGVGQGARAEAQKLAAENSRLRKKEGELMLTFRKQAHAQH